ncbi:unnamed protein product, partial [Closterium sp. NIES-53]
MPEGAARHGRTVEKRERTGPPEGSARETATGRLSGVRVVRSRKKERDAPESRVKVREAEADAVRSTWATTSTATPTPSAASTTTSTAPTGPTRSLAPPALARAASPTRGRRHSDRLKTTEVGRSGRGDRGQERGRRTPLKDG